MIAATIAQEIGVRPDQVETALKLLAEGNTVPFIARYRKEATGGLDDTQLRTIETRATYLRELEERKQAILEAIEEQGKLNDDLRREILECDTKARLEDLYLPYKKRRKTKADIAREAGLEPLLEELISQPAADPQELASKYLREGFEDEKKALDGARAIIIDRCALDADLVGQVREEMFSSGTMEASVVAGKETEGAKFKDYFEFAEPFSSLPSHRILALLRGESEGILQLNLNAGDDDIYENMIATRFELDRSSQWLSQAVRWSWRTKLYISAGLDVRMRLKEVAEEGALQVFATNLRDVLLAAPAGQRATLGLDPGYRNGVKCAVVDPTGKVLDTAIVYPHQPQNQWSQAVQTLSSLCASHGVDLLAVGNGTASRESEKLAGEVADLIAKAGGKRPTPVVVSESGASVYSASQIAADEFPNMDVSLRGAVSIA
ncbi:Tex-like N-terminal domain-containing protein, partial [Corynebacterium stationis]|uniref:Tex-like N-terminal domain-containing protein n=1 Tax=Corynebacterium stationis TaxID=1705 RepID=UPI00263B4B4E